ncbi:MAG: TlpA family protein disulfide reductase [Acidobacteria bacterium]|nr:TlpA family protein disulfide reductase [Acidobacteriota bacterium]
MLRLSLASALALVGVLLLPVTVVPAPGPDGWEALSTPAQSFVVEDVQGRSLSSKDLAGRVVVIDFWATWCSPCLRELPELVEYHRRLEGRDDVALLSFNVTDERADLEAFLAERKIAFPVYLGDDLIGPYELVAFPTKLVIDMREPGPEGRGVVRFRREGYTPAASIEARVEELLAAAP